MQMREGAVPGEKFLGRVNQRCPCPARAYAKYSSMIKTANDYRILDFIQSLNKLLRVGSVSMTAKWHHKKKDKGFTGRLQTRGKV